MAGYSVEPVPAAPAAEATAEEKDQKPKKSKSKIKTHASKEAARFSDDTEASKVKRGPDENGNAFDVRMAEEEDGLKAAQKIIRILKERGVCLIAANAPPDLLMAAHEEAVNLWEDGMFAPPLRISDDRGKLEAQCWSEAFQDEDKVCYIRTKEDNAKATQSKVALRALMNQMADFGGGLGQGIAEELGVRFDRYGHAMLSCYSGDKSYRLHIDNPHRCGDPERPTFADNGLRLSMAYYINTTWDPELGDCAGGMDVYLTNPKETPSSASSAKSAGKLRIAPHADTLVLFLSERMAHNVIRTTGSSDRWFCLTMWYLDGKAQQEAPRKLLAIQREQQRRLSGDSDDDD